MVDPGEDVSITLKREFMEEAANFLDKSDQSKKAIEDELKAIFKNGRLV